ncbi:MAG TPA: hypothetical protein VN999_15235 [Thermoanaerobaculia bacterium]|nr:hypothetical protein [Thermoanaerobaculia bacterium]
MNRTQTLPRTVVVVMLLTGVLAILAKPAAGAPCLDTFKKRGSIFTHWVYTASADFADVPVRVAVERLRQQLPSKQIEVLSANAEQGTLHCRTLPGNHQRTFDVDFTVSPLGSSARVTMVLTLPPTGVSDAGLKESMCDTVSVAALAVANPAAEGAAGTRPPAPDLPQPTPRAMATAAAAATPRPEPQEPSLTNEDVIKLVQAGLASDLIVTKIMQSPSVAFDLSTNGLVALANLKIPHDVIAAMLRRAHDGPR